MADCVIAMQNQTIAEKARRVAVMSKVTAEIVSIDPVFTRHGCSIGLRVSCDEIDKLKGIFERKKINYGDIIGKGSNL